MLDRVARLAVGGVLPVTALTFRDERQARTWNKRLRAQVVADARRRGLSRRRFGKTVVGLLVGGAALVAVVLAVAAGRYSARTPDEDDNGLAFGVLFFGFAILAGLASRYPGERDTAAGREAAARWLGVRDWLRGHEEFNNLPPAAVAVWDRYLAYGAAARWIPAGAHPAGRGDAADDHGEVLWLEVWKKISGNQDRPPVPWLYYLAVDDGSADRTVAWGLPAAHAGACQAGDTVRLTVRRWSRRVVELTVVEQGRSRRLPEPIESPPDVGSTVDVESTVDAGSTVDVDTDAPVPAALRAAVATVSAVLRGATVSVDKLLTAQEVGQALGIALRPPEVAVAPGPLAMATFATIDRGRRVLTVQVAQGAMAQWAWRTNARGTALPGIGDGAYVRGDRGVLRAGDAVVIVRLLRDAEGRAAQLPWLLTRAANRLTATAPPASGQ